MMELKLNKEIEIGDFVAGDDDETNFYLVCEIGENKYGLYSSEKHDGLLWYWKDECVLVRKAIYVEVGE